MTILYHGTVTGKDDLFLETFIITGALSNKSADPWDQRPGFYVSLHEGWAKLFGQNRSIDDVTDFKPASVGRGLIVEIDTDIDIEKFDFDHEMGGGWSFELLKNMREFIQRAAAQEEKEISFQEKTIEAQDLLLQFYNGMSSNTDFNIEKTRLTKKEKEEIKKEIESLKSELAKNKDDEFEKELIAHNISYYQNRLDGNDIRKETYYICHTPEPACTGHRETAQVFQAIHDILKENFPKEYQREKQRVFDRMVKSGHAAIKYTGSKPLKISKAYLRPDDFERSIKKGFDEWETVYDARKGSDEKSSGTVKPAATLPPPP